MRPPKQGTKNDISKNNNNNNVPHLETTLPEVSITESINSDSNNSINNNNSNGNNHRGPKGSLPQRDGNSLATNSSISIDAQLRRDDYCDGSPMPGLDRSFEGAGASDSSSGLSQPVMLSSFSNVGISQSQSTPTMINQFELHNSSSNPSRARNGILDEEIDTTVMPTLSSSREKSLSRRRAGSRGRRRGSSPMSSTGASVSNSSTTTSIATTSSSDRQRSERTVTVPQGRISVIEEEMDSGHGLRASLDAGMAAVRRWIRLRSGPSLQQSTSATRMIISDPTSSTTTTTATPLEMLQRDETGRLLGEDDDLLSFSTNHSEDVATSTSSVNSFDDFISSTTTPLQQSNNVRTANVSTGNIRLLQPPIMEEQQRSQRRIRGDSQWYRNPRQRALSEPDALTVRDFLFQRALSPQGGFRRRRYTSTTGPLGPITPNGGGTYPGHQRLSVRGQQRLGETTTTNNNGIDFTEGGMVGPVENARENTTAMSSSQLSTSAVEVLYTSASTTDAEVAEITTTTPSLQEGISSGRIGQGNNSLDNNSLAESDPDPQREARARWININRRFQVVITIVALVFSLLLFAILVCWVVLTSSYVMSMDKSCDVPLKAYFWLVTLQLILDVFRTDIMRLFFRWDSNSNQRIPCRVITYNVAYLTYALLVLRLGIQSVFVDDNATCRTTASALFQASVAFVSLSIAAWATIILGYLVPFCFVATLLTWNGYTPTSDSQRDGGTGPFPVFPTAMAAPPGCVDQLGTVRFEDVPSDLSKECCICMEEFIETDTIVKTACTHLYHRHCLADWLRHARTCPVCRMDIPSSIENRTTATDDENSFDEVPNHAPVASHGSHSRLGLVPATRTFGRNTDIHHEVVSLLQIIRRSEIRNRQTSSSGGVSSGELRNRSGSIEIRNRSRNVSMSQSEMVSSMEEGRNGRQY